KERLGDPRHHRQVDRNISVPYSRLDRPIPRRHRQRRMEPQIRLPCEHNLPLHAHERRRLQLPPSLFPYRRIHLAHLQPNPLPPPHPQPPPCPPPPLAHPHEGEPEPRLQRSIPLDLRLPLERIQELLEVRDDLVRPHILEVRPHQLDGQRVHLDGREQGHER